MALTKLNVRSISGDITADQLDVGQLGGRRNLIINGAMQVAQRGTSFTGDGWAADRFYFNGGGLEQFSRTISNSTDAPDGFSNSIKSLTTTAETSVTDTEYYRLYYSIEGKDCQYLAYGTAGAKTVTLSFYVKSNVTGTYAISMYAEDSNKLIGSTYTIDTADTWEHKTVSFVGDTSSSIANDNGLGLRIQWGIMVGPDRSSGSNSSWATYANANQFAGHTADWGEDVNDYINISGVQLEVGSVATPFEHRSYGEELALCQRYYFEDSPVGRQSYFSVGHVWSTTLLQVGFWPRVPMRTHPTLSHSGVYALSQNTAVDATNVSFDSGYEGFNLKINVNMSSSFTSGYAGVLLLQPGSYMKFDAEL
jgi:hypothetical protein